VIGVLSIKDPEFNAKLKEVVKVMVKEKLTLREAAANYGISRSRLHVLIHSELKKIDRKLYKRMLTLFKRNTLLRPYHGGAAAKLKRELEKAASQV
jgi:predicted DNA-binding protein (UPF0251 family)